jgi:serine/threonine-protein kinase
MKFRRRLSSGFHWGAWLPRPTGGPPGRLVPRVLLFAGAAVVGYLVAALMLFRAPVFIANATVPRVIGMSADSARQTLARADLKSRDVDRPSHPQIPIGHVVWQDPPSGIVVTAGTTVDLSVSAGPQRVPVPDVSDYDSELARLLVEAAGFTAAVESTQTSAPRGVTVNTRPPAGTAASPGTRVTLVVSQGAPTLTVPNVAGLTLDSVRTYLAQAGLTLGSYFSRTVPDGEPGTVIEQKPAAGTMAAPGTTVDVVLARRSPS